MMERYYRTPVDSRIDQNSRIFPQSAVINPIPIRSPMVYGSDGVQYPKRVFQNTCEDMTTQSYYLQSSVPNINECSTPDMYGGASGSTSYFPMYGGFNEEPKTNQFISNAPQDYNVHYQENQGVSEHHYQSELNRREELSVAPIVDNRGSSAVAREHIPEMDGSGGSAGSARAAHKTAGNQNAPHLGVSRKLNLISSSPKDEAKYGNVSSSAATGRPAIATSHKSVLDKQRNLHASGMRLFTGPVEKVIKWQKALQETGVKAIFEVIARCVSVRPACGCEKLLLLRDASGPVLQVSYFEIDFLLPEIQPGSTVRVVGSMVGSNRMKAFKVREALPSEPPSLPRLCAISQHIVAKLQAAK